MLNHEKLIFKVLDNLSNDRMRNIVFLRYGLKDGKSQTLEQIGRKYGITRERVRQIEKAAFFDLQKPGFTKALKPLFCSIDTFLNKEGRMSREERLLSSMTGTENPHPKRGAFLLALMLGQPYQRCIENNDFYSLWTNSEGVVNQARDLTNKLVCELKKTKTPLSFNGVYTFYKNQGINLPKRNIYSYLDASKYIGENSFGQIGLIKWPEISPRGAKDKAYLVLKQHNKPLHFSRVADLINEANLGRTPAQPQTVHNELIKDSRFVLVGRGIYALSEWGYQNGTIRDIIVQVLKEHDALSKDEVIERVLEKRMVKPNTVLINLQNKDWFKKDKKGAYKLIKAI